jgi:hypothetical protein
MLREISATPYAGMTVKDECASGMKRTAHGSQKPERTPVHEDFAYRATQQFARSTIYYNIKPCFSMKLTISSNPCPLFRLLKTNGFSPRMRLAS